MAASAQERLDGLAILGQIISQELANGHWQQAATQAKYENGWFTEEFVRMALHGITDQLEPTALAAWAGGKVEDDPQPKKVGVIMAGNLPAVGFADVAAVLAAGHHVLAKPSSQDTVLMKYLHALLAKAAPTMAARWTFIDRLSGQDAVIATGSGNTSRYFTAYFSGKPHIIRRNRSSVALLTGKETDAELLGLGEDVLAYFGLGCRSISALLVPAGYDIARLAPAWAPWAHLADHHKYANNLLYHRAIYLMNIDPFLDMGVVLLRKTDDLHTPLGVLSLIEYQTFEDAKNWIQARRDEIQVVAASPGLVYGSIPFGQAQHPALQDYADGIDTLAFLRRL